MKKYSKKNWNLLVIACLLGLVYAGYQIYKLEGRISSTFMIAFGFVLLLVFLILFVVNKFFRDKEGIA